jgi:hypothetical protein
MGKRLFVPAVVLGREMRGDLLEFSVEPGGFFNGDCFKPLRGSHLGQAIDVARRALRLVSKPRRKSYLYLVNPMPPVSNSTGAALGLALAAFMCEKQCPHQNIIATGLLDGKAENGDMTISDSGNLDARLCAALALGRQAQATPFIVPAGVELDQSIVQLLAQANIFICPARTLRQALDYCLFPLPEKIGRQGDAA